MLLFNALVILLLSVPLVFAVQFKGNCPVGLIPNSDIDSLDNFLIRTCLVSIPHSQSFASYFFQRIHYFANKQIVQLVQLVKQEHQSNYLLAFWICQETSQLSVEGSIQKFGSEIYLRSNMEFTENLLPSCFKPIVEKVNLWLNGSFLVLWSCKKVQEGYSDGALIVADLEVGGDLLIMLQEIIVATGKYLPASILNEIGLNIELLTVGTPDRGEFFYCPGPNYFSMLIFPFIFLIILILVLAFKRVLRNTQVHTL